VILVEDRLYAVSRTTGTFLIDAKPEFRVQATNKLKDTSDFNSSPVVSGGHLFLRSNETLYCIEEKAK
jgi:hypothetical protein